MIVLLLAACAGEGGPGAPGSAAPAVERGTGELAGMVHVPGAEVNTGPRGAIRRPTPERIFQLKRAMQAGMETAELNAITGIDPWFLDQLRELLDAEVWYTAQSTVDADVMRRMKRMGFSDRQLGALRGETEAAARAHRPAGGGQGALGGGGLGDRRNHGRAPAGGGGWGDH